MKFVGLLLSFSIVLTFVLIKVNCEEYLGCYKDGDDTERLFGHVRHFEDSLTLQVCITYCTGYAYAGLQDSRQCFCGDEQPDVSKKADEKDCSFQCSGNSSQICGGAWRNSVYKLENAIKAAVADIGYTYLGCFNDQANPRMLQGDYKDFGDFLTPIQCVKLCKDLGYHYAGLQYRTQCFCGDQTPATQDKAMDKECNARCSGDLTTLCGGNWKNTVYSTGLTQVTTVGNMDYKYEGCFEDDIGNRRLNLKTDFGERLVPESCLKLCIDYGYSYAGLQYRFECFCGDNISQDDKRPDSECQSKCSGDKTKICGGANRNTVYKTGISVKASVAEIGYAYLGCFKDQDKPRLLQGYYKDFGDNLNPLACVEFCKNLGYLQAGLENRHQCFCGDQILPDKNKLSDGKCNTKCTKNISTICGGDWRATVYATGLTQAASTMNVAYKYEGCYRDVEEPRKLNAYRENFGENLIPEECIGLCKQKGYRFAGLQFRIECFCGDDLLSSDKRPDSECQNKCSGDVTKFCGGSFRNTVYSTGILQKADVADTGYPYLGCYEDSAERRRLHEQSKVFEETLTPEMCIEYCKIGGYKYAGMQFSEECFCGNDYPSVQDKINDEKCNKRCSGDTTKYCGANFRNSIYSTNFIDSSTGPCATSVTIINGYKPTCKGQIVFFDSFSGNSISNNWNHLVQIADEQESEFVIYQSDASISYVKDGNLVIKPRILSNNIITSGRVQLSGCTGKVGTEECEKQARAYLILPPTESARLNTHPSFTFRYGRVDIRAKLPKGDWLVPDILLESKGNPLESDNSVTRIQMSMSRGNEEYSSNGKDLSCKALEVGIFVIDANNFRELTTVLLNTECWHLKYHDFSLIWNREKILFLVDGRDASSMVRAEDGKLSKTIGLEKSYILLWNGNKNRQTVFDSDFYITLGVTIGGAKNFPDNSTNRGRNKPWKNTELKRTLNFWKDRQYWESTWSDQSALLVDYVKVTAL